MSDERTLKDALRPADTVHAISIVVARGPDAGKKLDAKQGEGVSIGAAEDNDLVLTDPKVSRYHAELSPDESGVAVKDLGSANGSFVGNTRVSLGVLARGAQLRLGDTVLVVDSVRSARDREAEAPALPGLVYESRAMKELARAVHRLATFNGAVLVQGETGSGKELVAAALHASSSRAEKPFVIVDCGALPPTLVSSELFGHEKGAFTGADRMMPGAFERANGGTIFLDEIGELPLAMQPVLLGVLQRKQFRRVGGTREIPVDVRVIVATHKDLRAEVNRGTFREDLYFRLAGARLIVAPLRERKEDVPLLVRHFVQELTGEAEHPALDATAISAFCMQSWPGNVRELRSAVERAIASGVVDATGEASAAANEGSGGAPLVRYRDARAEAIAAFEAKYVGDLIRACDGNASEAARRAGMDRPYLLTLLRKYGLR
jgi:DNA-binding NtrC family response regulator